MTFAGILSPHVTLSSHVSLTDDGMRVVIAAAVAAYMPVSLPLLLPVLLLLLLMVMIVMMMIAEHEKRVDGNTTRYRVMTAPQAR